MFKGCLVSGEYTGSAEPRKRPPQPAAVSPPVGAMASLRASRELLTTQAQNSA
jgi:hypothetical protein